MIARRIVIDHDARTLHTHRDSYRLDGLTVVSVRRPFQPAGMVVAALAGAFSIQFHELLYPAELLTALGVATASLILGLQIGRLSLLSRDLRGSPLGGVVWGRAASLHSIRHRIIAALAADRSMS